MGSQSDKTKPLIEQSRQFINESVEFLEMVGKHADADKILIEKTRENITETLDFLKDLEKPKGNSNV